MLTNRETDRLLRAIEAIAVSQQDQAKAVTEYMAAAVISHEASTRSSIASLKVHEVMLEKQQLELEYMKRRIAEATD